jgi:hypothetical protein
MSTPAPPPSEPEVPEPAPEPASVWVDEHAPPEDEATRQALETVRSVSRLEESN